MINWPELLSAIAAWAAVASGYGYWRHQQAKSREERQAEALNALRAQMTLEHDAVLSQIRRETEGTNNQIRDIVKSLGDNFVTRRENEIAMRGINEQLIDIRKDVGAVGVQVADIQSRMFELYSNAAFRKAPH